MVSCIAMRKQIRDIISQHLGGEAKDKDRCTDEIIRLFKKQGVTVEDDLSITFVGKAMAVLSALGSAIYYLIEYLLSN